MRLFLTVLIIMLLASCSTSPKQQVLNTNEQTPTILVAIQKGAGTSFKQAIIEDIKKDYSADYKVLVKDVNGYKDLKDEKYSALIVMDQLKAWLFFNGALKNIAKNADKQKTIYFISAGDPDWKWKREDLKIVTSATVKVSPDTVYSQIKGKLDEVLGEIGEVER